MNYCTVTMMGNWIRNNSAVSVKVVRDRFREVDAQIKARVEDIVEGAAIQIAEYARQLAPKSKGRHRSDFPVLSESIYVEGDGDHVRVKVDAPHAGYVEWGTINMAAQPYLRPAVNFVTHDSIRSLESAGRSVDIPNFDMGAGKTRIVRKRFNMNDPSEEGE